MARKNTNNIRNVPVGKKGTHVKTMYFKNDDLEFLEDKQDEMGGIGIQNYVRFIINDYKKLEKEGFRDIESLIKYYKDTIKNMKN